MSNPFDGNVLSIDNRDELIGREEIFKEIEDRINKRRHVVLQGVYGTGKTSILKSFFNLECRIKLAREKNIIVAQDCFPVQLKGEDVYKFFYGIIRNALSVLTFCEQKEKYTLIKESIKENEKENDNAFVQLQSLVKMLRYNFELRILIVLDAFEQFTSSKNVTADHHGQLRALMVGNDLQFVLATDFDLTEDSLDGLVNVNDSFLIQNFLNNEKLVLGFKENETEEYLNRYLENSGYAFSDYERHVIHVFSGGIPNLIRITARFVLNRKQMLGRELTSEDFDELLQEIVSEEETILILEKWYKKLNQDQFDTIQAVLGNPEYRVDSVSAKKFYNRGIFIDYVETDPDGREETISGVYDFNSVILQEFSRDTEKLKRLMKPKEQSILTEGRMAEIKTTEGKLSEGKIPAGPGNSTTIIVEKGGNLTLGTSYSNEMNVDKMVNIEKVVKIESLSVSGLIAVLDDPEKLKQYSRQIGEQFKQARLSIEQDSDVLADGQPEYDEATEAKLDVAISEIGDTIAEKFDATGEEKQSLDSRFERARRIHPKISDAFLQTMSDRAQLYLKIAVIVEDALSVLKNIEIEDLSAQVVMYGKVLEQVLRDSFYPLFTEDSEINQIPVIDKKTFCQVDVKKTMIGNYSHMIYEQCHHLATISNKYKICVSDVNTEEMDLEAWENWWSDFSYRVNKARKLRNNTDHAGSKVSEKQSQDMCDYLIGSEKIESIILHSQIGYSLLSKVREDTEELS